MHPIQLQPPHGAAQLLQPPHGAEQPPQCVGAQQVAEQQLPPRRPPRPHGAAQLLQQPLAPPHGAAQLLQPLPHGAAQAEPHGAAQAEPHGAAHELVQQPV